MKRVSVIIPFYNGDKERLDKCISSIENSASIEHEIILVNDGSLPSYDKFLQSICKKYRNVRLVKQNNKGVSSARNLGVSVAEGEYVAFVDADDEVLNGFIDASYAIASRKKADILIGKIFRGATAEGIKEGSGKIVRTSDKVKLKTHLISYNSLCHFRDKTYVGRGCWSRLIKRDIAISTPFDPELKVGEDIIWNLEAVDKTDRVYLINTLWYFYHENEVSVSNAFNDRVADDYEKLFKRLFGVIDINKESLYKELVAYFFESMKTIHRLMLYNRLYESEPTERKALELNIYERFEFPEIFESDLYDSLSLFDKTQMLLFKGKKLFIEYNCFRRLRDIKRSFK